MERPDLATLPSLRDLLADAPIRPAADMVEQARLRRRAARLERRQVESPRAAARRHILQKVNRLLVRRQQQRAVPFPARLLGSRNIQQAVCIARRNPGLVADEVFVAAGFRPSKASV